jgi:hypothetical protein
LNGIAISHDTLFALDRRLHAFDTAGVYLASSEGNVPIYSTNSITATPRGLVLIFRPPTPSTTNVFQFASYDFKHPAAPQDTFSMVQHLIEYGDPLHRPNLPNAIVPPHYAASNGLGYFAVGDSFHVDLRDATGAIIRSYIATIPKVSVSATDKRDFIENVHAEFRRITGRSEENYAREVEPLVTPEYAKRSYDKYRQAISLIIASESGLFMLARSDITKRPYRQLDPTEYTLWTLLDSHGNVRSHIELPSNFLPKVFTACTLYGVSFTPDGTELVVRYDLSAVCGRRARED